MESGIELQNAETIAVVSDGDGLVKMESEQSNMELTKELHNEQENKCSCENKNCEIRNSNSNHENDKLYPSSSKESHQCNYCGGYFECIFAYRRHHLKCWRAFCRKATLSQNSTESNKPFEKKDFSVNNTNINSRKSCNICGLKFRSRLQYAMHVRRKKFCRPPPFICGKCGRVFKHLHLLISHEKRKIPCTLMGTKSGESTSQKTTASPVELEDQSAVKKNDDIVNCEICGMQFASFQWYEKHISQTNCFRLRDGKMPNISQKKFKTPYLEKFRTVRGYKCKRCGHLFRYPYRLRDHLMRKVPCIPRSARKTMPPVKSLSNESQKDETSVIDNIVEEKCPNIENTNANVGRKIIRKYWKIANTHSKQRKRQVDVMNKYGTLICCICNKKFFNSYTWNNHLRIHSTAGEKCFVKCPVCQTVFRSAYMLYCHQKKTNHWGKLMKSRINYCQCPFCGKKFSYVGSRKNHVQLHMQDYPSAVKEFLENTTCSSCNIHFVSEAKKLAHMRKVHLTESDIKTENIENCTKGKQKIKQEFPPQSSKYEILVVQVLMLLFPIRKMLGEDKASELHSCTFCFKKFSRLSFLIRHHQETHNECLTFQCGACNQKFSNKSMISQHIKRKHRAIPKSNLIIKIDKASNSEIEPKLEDEDEEEEDENETKDEQTLHFQSQSIDDLNNSKRGIYSCELCNLNHFRKVSALRRHKKSKLHKDNLMQSKLGENAKLAFTHDKKKTPKILICSACNQSFDSLRNFIPHRLNHFNFQNADPAETVTNEPYYCEICSKVIIRQKRIETHLLGHLRRHKVQLKDTSCSNDNTDNLKQSLTEKFTDVKDNSKTETEQKVNDLQPEKYEEGQRRKKVNFTCKVCKRSFRTKRLHTFHVRYRCRFQLTCEHCKKQFPSKKKYRLHKERLRCKVPQPKLHCQYCSLDFSSVSDLKWHEKSCQKVHGTESGDFNLDNMNNLFHCQYCHSPFLTLQTCQEHENYCKKEAFCSICRSYFTSYELLNKHNNEFHTSEKLLTCLVCGKVFQNIKSLNSHMETHSSEEIRECSSQTNHNSTKLKSENMLSCHHCNTSFQEQHDLKEHLVIHNPFTCPVCGKVENNVHGFRKHPCRLPNGTLATGLVFKRKQTKLNYIQNDKELIPNVELEAKNNCSELSNNAVALSEETSELDKVNRNHEEGSTENNDEFREKMPLDILRDNFSQLLYLFVADPELMSQFGWGQRLIDDVLDDVLQNMGQNSIDRDSSLSELERLRGNIRVLLRICIKDQVMDAVDSNNKSIDEIVIDMLGMCQASLEGQTTISDNTS
ncbi:LOW QUALITY PROTEIN: zinc finger protein 721-like [Centruroides vittatus]|uniref:LOW QUALITY PROTEIN: zinc finger protein 721-like n=1 Tax=Centruroides vittatus TaxID=120091 RepID=UPI00350F4610